jgi:hypothetical protein
MSLHKKRGGGDNFFSVLNSKSGPYNVLISKIYVFKCNVHNLNWFHIIRNLKTYVNIYVFSKIRSRTIRPLLLTNYLLLDRKGLLCVAEALAYVDSPTKVDIFFTTFCKKIPRIY